MSLQLRNIIQCPSCSFKVTEQMPRERKIMSYTCPACGTKTSASDEDCCIFCKIGRWPCPLRQAENQEEK